MVAACLMIGGIGAHYLLNGRGRAFGKRTVSLVLGVLAVLLPLQVYIDDSEPNFWPKGHGIPFD